MTTASMAGSKRVGYLELFFDLVFVFVVTQLVTLLDHDHSAAGWGRAAILLWLTWWAWSQYAWAGNAIDLRRRSTSLWFLVAAGGMLAAAAALPNAFTNHEQGLAFAALYAAVCFIGLGLYWVGLAGDSSQRAALRSYLPIQMISPVLVLIGGFADGDWRVALWTGAILVDIVSAIAAGRGEFRIDPAHFAERHGLIVIIALGESVVAIGATTSEIGLSWSTGLLLTIGFAAVGGFWWCYFDWVHEAAQSRLVSATEHRDRAQLARDLFTFGHLPIVAGTVVWAAAIEQALLGPNVELSSFGVTALTVGPALYFLGFVTGNLRATGQLLRTRAIGLTAVVVVAPTAGLLLPSTAAVAAVAAIILAVAVAERNVAGNVDPASSPA